LNEAVGKGRFSVINMCDDAEVTNVFHEVILEICLSSEVVLKRSEEPLGEINLTIINYFLPKISFFFSMRLLKKHHGFQHSEFRA
jgi:hypothetical protein